MQLFRFYGLDAMRVLMRVLMRVYPQKQIPPTRGAAGLSKIVFGRLEHSFERLDDHSS